MCSLVLAACGGAASSSGSYMASNDQAYAGAGDADYAPAAAEETAEYETSDEEDKSEETPGAQAETGQLQQDKLVYTANLKIQTLNYQESLESIRSKIANVGGIIQSENESNSNYTWYYEDADSSGRMMMDLTVRIPTAKYQEFLNSLEGDGKIISKSSSVTNISRQYHDTEARIRSLETQEARLQQMMANATTVEDMITIDARLSDVQAELDSLRTYLASMDTDVNYSTVYINLEEVKVYSKVAQDLTVWERIKNRFRDSWDFFTEAIIFFLNAIVYLLPFAVLALIILIIVLAVRKARGKTGTRQPGNEKKRNKPGKKPRWGRKKPETELKSTITGESISEGAEGKEDDSAAE